MPDFNNSTFKINIAGYHTTISVNKPDYFNYCIIIANGAGGNLSSPFIKKYFDLIAANGFMTVSFNFYYQDIGRKIPDKNEKCQETYLGVIAHLLECENLNEKKIVLAGKSMGGRIATQIARRTQSEKIVVLGYPLHPPGKPEKLRDQHLYSLQQDILFIQGENDTFGNQQEMETVIQRIKNARMVSIPHANHSLNIPKKYSINPEQTENMVIESIINFLSK